MLPAATLSAAPENPPAPGDQYDPAVAFDGTNYLVVWRDDRALSDVHGARVTQQGAVLDEDSIRSRRDPATSGSREVAFDGTNYLVVWEDIVDNDRHVYGRE